MSSDKKPPTLVNWLWPNAQLDFSKATLLGRLLGTGLAILAFVLTVGVVGALATFIAAVFHVGPYHGLPTDAAIRNIGLVLIAALGAPFVAWRSWVAHRQAIIAEQGLITDRINKAVQGLGAEKTVKSRRNSSASAPFEVFEYEEITAPNLEVRIGSIYALERVANESVQDRPQIFETLCSYVGNNGNDPELYPHPPPKRFTTDDLNPTVEERFRGGAEGMGRDWASRLRAPRPDIGAAITVIVRCIDRFNVETIGAATPKLSFDGANLQRARLGGANLRGATFTNCQLDGADLENSDLSQTTFDNCSLIGASMNKANLAGARFTHSRLECVNAGNVPSMEDCLFWECDCSGMTFEGADMSQAVFHVTARKTVFRAKKMDRTHFMQSDIRDGVISAHSMINTVISSTWVPPSGVQLMQAIRKKNGVGMTKVAKKMRLFFLSGQPNLVSSDGIFVPGFPEALRPQLLEQGDGEQFDPRTGGQPIVTVE